MDSPQRIGVIGWFLRAFAAGFGVVFGVGSALLLGVIGYLLLAAAGSTMLSSGSPVEVELSQKRNRTSLESLTKLAPSNSNSSQQPSVVAPVEWEQAEVTGSYPPHPYALEPVAEQSPPLAPAPTSASLPTPLYSPDEEAPATAGAVEPAVETSTQPDATSANAADAEEAKAQTEQ